MLHPYEWKKMEENALASIFKKVVLHCIAWWVRCEWDLHQRVAQERLEATAKEAHFPRTSDDVKVMVGCKLLLIPEKLQKWRGWREQVAELRRSSSWKRKTSCYVVLWSDLSETRWKTERRVMLKDMECFDEKNGDTKQRFYRDLIALHCIVLWLRMLWRLKIWKQNTLDSKHQPWLWKKRYMFKYFISKHPWNLLILMLKFINNLHQSFIHKLLISNIIH